VEVLFSLLNNKDFCNDHNTPFFLHHLGVKINYAPKTDQMRKYLEIIYLKEVQFMEQENSQKWLISFIEIRTR
jgi:hypothetical protein